MTRLFQTELSGSVHALLRNGDAGDESIQTRRVERVRVLFDGFEGERHSGAVKPSDVRFRRLYPVGTPIRNTRQVSLLSLEELTALASDMDLPVLEPEWLGANLVVSGIPDLTLLPPSTRLLFASGAALVVDNQNMPCAYPAKVVESHHAGAGARFVRAAKDRRGLVGWVEKEGEIAVGDAIAVHLPPKRIYPHG